MDLLAADANDAVADVLNAIRVQSSVYCLSDLRAPWGFRVDSTQVAKFHLVLTGTCWLEPDRHEPILLTDGDLAILPRGTGHVLRDEPGSSVLGLDAVLAAHPLDDGARLRYGGVGSSTRLLCGGFGVSDSSASQLLARLPAVIRLDFLSVRGWLEPLVTLLRYEADRAAPGAQAIFAKLADVLLGEALRTYLTSAAADGLLAGVPDAQVARAAQLLTQHPDRPWTLQLLAREVGLSRSLLAARFRAATGDSPMRHLTRIRLQRAAKYLSSDGLSIEAIAGRTGYASSAALSKAFKREFGVSPGTYRRGTAHVRVHDLPVPVR